MSLSTNFISGFEKTGAHVIVDVGGARVSKAKKKILEKHMNEQVHAHRGGQYRMTGGLLGGTLGGSIGATHSGAATLAGLAGGVGLGALGGHLLHKHTKPGENTFSYQ